MDKTFGRIPEKTCRSYEQIIAASLTQVVTVLPANAGEELKSFTVEKVLEIIFRDRNENGNTDELRERDWKDLASFVQMAAELAGKQISTQGKPIYEASLSNLLDDWLHNWNADGDAGSPRALGSFIAELSSRWQANPKPGTGSSGIAKSASQTSPFGRISQRTFELFASQIQNTVEPVLSHLPLEISRELRDWTVKTTLEYVFLDWRANGNLDPLGSADVSDLGSFAELALHLAKSPQARNGSHNTSELNLTEQAIYKTVLRSLLADWLENWNANGVNGPPR